MKAKIISKQGPYRFADGSIATISGRAQPLTTYAQAQALADVWIKVASDLFEKLRKAGKADKAGPLNTAVAQFHMRQADWFLWMNDTYGSNRSKFKGKYLFLPAADKFYQNLGFFISHVNSAANSALAARTEWELLGEAINETSGGFLRCPRSRGRDRHREEDGCWRSRIFQRHRLWHRDNHHDDEMGIGRRRTLLALRGT